MFDVHFKRPGRLALGAAVAAVVLTLAACGGSSNDGGGTVPPVTTTPTPGSTLDSFIQIVKALVATTSETTEPVPVTDVVPTTPENVEPDPTV